MLDAEGAAVKQLGRLSGFAGCCSCGTIRVILIVEGKEKAATRRGHQAPAKGLVAGPA